ncbi:hypothetical protein [Flavobacterium rhizosphaerae]|uniref:Uncharacterized protein n=1 Tax=Flavobacterium rhizosphaerae TaxID=3163298 RepID=A0ABW8YZM9_9FLAO
MDFKSMDIRTLTRSVTGEGVRYLEIFLREYTALFPGPVNPSCNKCLNEYLTKYKKHYSTMANTCKYRLHAKYENIPLGFGSSILVNNANITNEYAQKLLNKPNGQRFFAVIPEEESATQEITDHPEKKGKIRKYKDKVAGNIPDTGAKE